MHPEHTVYLGRVKRYAEICLDILERKGASDPLLPLRGEIRTVLEKIIDELGETTTNDAMRQSSALQETRGEVRQAIIDLVEEYMGLP